MWKMLLVEDEKPMLEWLKAYIERLFPGRFEIDMCYNGRDALQVYGKRRHDIIITDIRMPVMDGLGLLKDIGGETDRPFLIVLSNYDNFTIVRTAFKNSADEYMLKSEINDDVLIEAIGNFMSFAESRGGGQMQQGDACLPEAIAQALKYIERNYATIKGLKEVAGHVCLNPEYFSRLFKAETGSNFSLYLNDFRLARAAALMEKTDLRAYEIAEKVGFSSISYFSACFKKKFGISPFRFRNPRGDADD